MDAYPLLTSKEISKVKKIAKIINYDWKTICARATWAKELISLYDSGELK